MILVKFVSKSGVLSRRNSEDSIKNGDISVNGQKIFDPRYEVDEKKDVVFYQKRRIISQEKIYIIFNKPSGMITTKNDPSERKTIFDIFPQELRRILDPVGRLDINSTGILLLTNDGEMINYLSHPRFCVKKIYNIVVSRDLDEELVDRLRKGIRLEEGFFKPDKVIWSEDTPSKILIELHSAQYRIIKKVLESFSIFIKKMNREVFGPLELKGLKKGNWRFLTQIELDSVMKVINLNKKIKK